MPTVDTDMIQLPWLRRDCAPVYALTIEPPQLDDSVRRSDFDPFQLAAASNHGVKWEWLHMGAALFGDVEIDAHHAQAADWRRDWMARRPVYPVTFLFEEF